MSERIAVPVEVAQTVYDSVVAERDALSATLRFERAKMEKVREALRGISDYCGHCHSVAIAALSILDEGLKP